MWLCCNDGFVSVVADRKDWSGPDANKIYSMSSARKSRLSRTQGQIIGGAHSWIARRSRH